MAQPSPSTTATNPRIQKLIELETTGRIKPEHQTELDGYRAMGLAPKDPNGKLTEDQSKSTGFYERGSAANTNFLSTGTDSEGNPSGIGPRGALGQSLAINHPDLLNTLPAAIGNSSERQRADQAQREFLAAVLRKDSGAVIGAEEMGNYGRIYFPMPGDGPDVITQKAHSRETALQGLKVAAGPGVRTVTGPTEGDIGFATPRQPEQSTRGGQLGFEDAKAHAYDLFMQTNPRASADQIRAFGISIGAPIGNADDIVKARDAGAGIRPGSDAVVEPRKIASSIPAAIGSGVADTALLGGADEIGGLVDTVRDQVTGRSRASFLDNLYTNIDQRRAEMDADRDAHPIAYAGGQLYGGAAIPYGSGARTAAELAKVGAISGGAYGFGSGDGVLGRVASAGGGALSGAAGGYAFGRAAPIVGNALSRFGQPSQTRVAANALADAAERQGVPLTAADVRPGARNALAFLEAAPGGNGPVRSALEAGNDAIETAVGGLGRGGTVGTPAPIGDAVQAAGRRAIDWSRTRKNQLYDQAEQLAGNTTVQSANAVSALDAHIGELSQTPNANRGILNLLTDLRDDLVERIPDPQNAGQFIEAPRNLSIQSIRNLRTAMRGEIGTRNLTMTDAERRIGDVIDAASNDIGGALYAAGRDNAAQAYGRADSFYRQRQQMIGDVVQRFIGRRDQPMSGEQAYARLTAMMSDKGDSRRFRDMMGLLTPDEQSDVAATVAGTLGRRAPEDDFSPARFVTMVEKLTPEARRTAFGQDGENAIGDLIRIASARRDTVSRLNNSRSGQVMNYDRALTMGLGLFGGATGYAGGGGVAGAAVGAAAAGGLKMGAMNVSARLLTNPAFVRWLGRAPSTTSPTQIATHVRQLGAIAARQPAVRGEIEQLERLLTDRTASRALASDGSSDGEQDGDGRQATAAGR